MLGILYIVATPIGNLEDITLRALRILKEVDVILAEDTRKTGILLKHYDIVNNILSYHQYSDERKKIEILNKIISGKNVALVTDAGTPGVSDPGNELVSYIAENLPDIKIVPIPGASAISSALSVSGMNVNSFVFLGFLPKKRRTKIFKWLKEGVSSGSGSGIPFVFFESPYRIIKTLEVLEKEFGEDTKVFIGRELTKIYETLYRGTLKEVKELLLRDKVRGELVVIVNR